MYDRKASFMFITALLVLASVLAGCGAVTGAGTASLPSAQGYLDTISVTGFGEAYGAPDTGTIQLGFSTSNVDVGQAMSQSNATVERLTQAMLGLGIAAEDIQTTNFSVWPEERYDPASGLPSGEKIYRVENTISVKIRQLDSMPQVIESGLANGANNLYGLNFSIDDSGALAAEARSAAVADARARAGELAAELGVTLGDARIANEIYNTGYPASFEAAIGVGGGGAPPISEGQLSVNIQVVVTFDIVR
jgi:hypothetical protein